MYGVMCPWIGDSVATGPPGADGTIHLPPTDLSTPIYCEALPLSELEASPAS